MVRLPPTSPFSWPDPLPQPPPCANPSPPLETQVPPLISDVSRLYSTPILSIHQPHTHEDVIALVKTGEERKQAPKERRPTRSQRDFHALPLVHTCVWRVWRVWRVWPFVHTCVRVAVPPNTTITIRGTQHSMGGHTSSKNSMLIDTKYLNNVSFSPETALVTCGPGALWSDLIVLLDPYHRSPHTMQSYCTFSVGGSLSVNAHGITSDGKCERRVKRCERRGVRDCELLQL